MKWKTRSGAEIEISQLTDAHLRNILRSRRVNDDLTRELNLEAGKRRVEIGLQDRGELESLVVGALRDCISHHGPITRDTAPSAAKRVIGAIKCYNERRQQS